MKHLYVPMPWPEDMCMLWIKFLSFVSVFCSANFSCSIIFHIFKDKHKVAGDTIFTEFACSLLNWQKMQ